MKKHISLLVTVFLSTLITAQSQSQKTASTSASFCNPLNLSYRFQLEQPSRREAADPVIVLFRGQYFLFASKSGGYWSSPDLNNWKFISTTDLPLEDYAPATLVMNDTLYFCASNAGSRNKCIYKTANPESGKWTLATDQFEIYNTDPAFFLDDDGKLYLYHGCSDRNPIYVVHLDPKTFQPIGPQVECFNSNTKIYGWERPGDYNTETRSPWIEGAWMTKYKGTYYLQYAAPGTEFKSYADGIYTSSSPMGPFKPALHNPFSYKPEGFIAGAGHSATFQDKYGNYWHIATMSISVKHMFERRLGLFPAFFDNDGEFYTWTAFGDFPHVIPERKITGPKDYQPSAMLLSYGKPVEVSSEMPAHPKENATAENIRNYWSALTGNKDEWIVVDLKSVCSVSSVQVNFAEEGTSVLGRTTDIYHQYLLEYSVDRKNWKMMIDQSGNKTDVPHDFTTLKSPVKARYIRLTNVHVPDGKFAISGLRIFGKGSGNNPAEVTGFNVKRDASDGCRATLTWKKNADAVGYNIRFGTHPEKLYQNYQVFDAGTITINSLNKLQKYYFSIDAFNENGISVGKTVVAVD